MSPAVHVAEWHSPSSVTSPPNSGGGISGDSWDAAWEAAEAAVGGAEPTENQFMALLESLEARVDLMSQMQHTRAAIQNRAKAIEAIQTGRVQPPKVLPEARTELWEHFQDQQECINRLAGEVEGMRAQLRHLGVSSPMPGNAPALAQASPLDATQPVGPVEVKAPVNMVREIATEPVGDAQEQTPFALPFSREVCGVNLSLTGDGYIAARMRGCRQSVAIGCGPLPLQAFGRYFEVTVLETVAGWVGGLGIGVTCTSPTDLGRMPDKAWRMSRSFIVGYWGCIFVDGQERRTAWRSDSLCVGARVGLLVTGDGRGDLIVFVNDRPVVRAEGALASEGGEAPAWREPLYPVVDVFAATRVVELSRRAAAPPPPWDVDGSLERPSAPGTPASGAASAITKLNLRTPSTPSGS